MSPTPSTSEAQPEPSPAPAEAEEDAGSAPANATPEAGAPEPESAVPVAAAQPAQLAATAPPGEPLATESDAALKSNWRAGGGTSALRAQLAKERARQVTRWSRRHLRAALLAVVVLGLGGWLLRMPVYRALARQGGPLSDWAVEQLVEARDPGSFEVFLHRMGTPEGRELCGEVVYLLAGRRSLPPALAEDEEPSGEITIPEDPEAIDEHCAAIARALQAEERSELQLAALYTLNYLTSRDWVRWQGSEELLVLASRLLAHPGDAHRRLAALVLASYRAPEAAQPALVRAVSPGEPDPRVRAFAIEALSRLGEARYQPAIAAALEDPDPQVRAAARSGLDRLGSTLTVEELEGLVSGDARRRDAALQLLAEKPGARATDLLLQLSGDDDAATRRAALAGLGERLGDRPRQAFERALLDYDPQVRLLAITTLRERPDGAQALPALRERMANWSEEEPDTGWNELLELHRALKGLTGIKGVPSPTPEPPSWRATQRGWAGAF